MHHDYERPNERAPKRAAKPLYLTAIIFMIAGALVLGVPILISLLRPMTGMRLSMPTMLLPLSQFGVIFFLIGIFLLRAFLHSAARERQKQELERKQREAFEESRPASVYPSDEGAGTAELDGRSKAAETDYATGYDASRYEEHSAFRPRLRCYECGMSNEEDAAVCIQCGHKL